MRLAFLLFATSGCSGIWTGDSGSDGDGPCVEQGEAVADTASTPAGFNEPVAVTLAPADAPFSGALTLESGEAVPLAVTFELDDSSVRAVRWAPAPGEDAQCRAPALKADLTLTIDAGATLSAQVRCNVFAGDGALTLATYTGDAAEVTTTLAPSFSRPPLGTPLPITALEHRDGRWRGTWQWFAYVDCGDEELCSGLEMVPLGSVELGAEEP